MTEHQILQTRREAILASAAAGAAVALLAGADAAASEPGLTGHEHDWDFLVGRWSIRHHRLKGRLMGSTEWEDFNSSCVMWLTMGGLGNVDDNVLELPGGTYRAMGFRAFDPKAGQWRIWWLDGRYPGDIEPPVMGGFKDGIGIFVGDDTLRGQPIKTRFRWSKITPTSAHWEQACSPDGGATWEVNWTMELTRTG
jgi:hypothetical protein